LKRKYVVIDWIEGKNLSEKNLMSKEIKNEIDFCRMILLLLREVELFHKNNFFHCDIRPENIVSTKYCDQIYFMLIDYGSSFKKGQEDRRVFTFSKGFTPENDTIWDSKSDIHALG
jgi:serine/threonine protein kinase